MSWDQFYSTVKKTAAQAADKINQTADVATLQVKLSMAERRLNEAYAALGRVSYRHFTSDENLADAVAKVIAPVEIAMANVRAIKKELAARKQESTSEGPDSKKGNTKA